MSPLRPLLRVSLCQVSKNTFPLRLSKTEPNLPLSFFNSSNLSQKPSAFHYNLMVTKGLSRILSAFNRSTRRWGPITSRSAQSHVTQASQRLSLTSWNLDAFSSRPVFRAKLILGHILEGSKCPDIIIFQEVTPNVRDYLLDDARVRATLPGV